MKVLFTFLLFLNVNALLAQNTCSTAIQFCTGASSLASFPASINSGSAATGPDYGCLFTQPNPTWFYMQVSVSGSLNVSIQGTITSPPGIGQDVDFICWGPFNSFTGNCDSLTANKIVDCAYSGSFTETLNIPNANAGEIYLVMVTNFANVQQNIIFTKVSGAGTINCSPVSIKEYSTEDFSFYPNPAEHYFTLKQTENNSKLEIEIYSLLGELVYSAGTTEQMSEHSIAGLSKGMYTLQIKSGNRRSKLKLLKQ